MAFYPIALLPPQFSNPSNGENASGFILQARVAGTTSLTDFYSDSAGTSVGSSITLNSGGFTAVSGNVFVPYLDDNITYKFTLTDPDTLIQFTVDNLSDVSNSQVSTVVGKVTGYIFDTVADMAAGTTSGGVSVTPVLGGKLSTLGYHSVDDGGGADYVVTNDTANAINIIGLGGGLSATLMTGPEVNVKQFGARGDGTTDDLTLIQTAIDYAGTIVLDIGGGQDMDQVTGIVRIPAGRFYISDSIDMVNNVTLIGVNKGVSWITTDQSITMIEYPDISPKFYTNTSVENLGIENTTGNVGKGVHPFRCARDNRIYNCRFIGSLRNVHVEDCFTLMIDQCHMAGQTSDNNILLTGSIIGEVIIYRCRLDGSVSANIFWNEPDRGELTVRDTVIQFCNQEAIRSRNCRHVILDNVFMEGCYTDSIVAGYWVDLQGATAGAPFGVSTTAVVTNTSCAGSSDSGVKQAGLGLFKFNVFDRVTFSPKWARHYNDTAPTVTGVSDYQQPTQILSNTTPYPNGLGLNMIQSELSSDGFAGVSSDFDSSVTNAGYELKTRNDAGSAWTYAALYKRGSTVGIYQETSSPGLTGTPVIGSFSDGGKIHDNTGVLHFHAKNDGFTFTPRVYANTSGSSANVVVSSSGNLQRSTSSRRFKENERQSDFDTSQVFSLMPVMFDYIDGEKDVIGLIAEDSGPYCQNDEDGLPEGINWNLIIVSLVAEIKSLKEEINNLRLKLKVSK